MKTSCISHPPKTPIVLIREDFLAICDENHCEAAILNQFVYWTDVKLGHREQAETENEIARTGGMEGTQTTDLWIYKTQKELHKELLGLFGERAIVDGLQSLTDRGFLKRRNNPKYAWDRTYQYQLQDTIIQDAILQKCKMESANIQDRIPLKSKIESPKSEQALPEITTEINPEKENSNFEPSSFDLSTEKSQDVSGETDWEDSRSDLLEVTIEKLSRTFGDVNHLKSNIQQSYNIWDETDLGEEGFVAKVEEAAAITKEAISKSQVKERNKRMAYFFAVLRELAFWPRSVG